MIDKNLREDGEKAAREVKLLLLGRLHLELTPQETERSVSYSRNDRVTLSVHNTPKTHKTINYHIGDKVKPHYI